MANIDFIVEVRPTVLVSTFNHRAIQLMLHLVPFQNHFLEGVIVPDATSFLENFLAFLALKTTIVEQQVGLVGGTNFVLWINSLHQKFILLKSSEKPFRSLLELAASVLILESNLLLHQEFLRSKIIQHKLLNSCKSNVIDVLITISSCMTELVQACRQIASDRR